MTILARNEWFLLSIYTCLALLQVLCFEQVVEVYKNAAGHRSCFQGSVNISCLLCSFIGWSKATLWRFSSFFCFHNASQMKFFQMKYLFLVKLESSQSPHTSAKAMLFARWQHHLRFCSGLPYAPLKAMVTKISKWSRIQDSFRITPKIESLVVCAVPDIPSKFQKDPSITFWVILLTHTPTDRQTDKQTNKQSLAKT